MQYKIEKQYRLKNYDYSQEGYYFVTICTKNKEEFLGNIVGVDDDVKAELSKIGKIVEKVWLEIPEHFKNVELDEYVIIPNHIHGIIVIKENEYSRNIIHHVPDENCINGRNIACYVPTNYMNYTEEGSKFGKITQNSLSVIIRSFKSAVTKYLNENIPNHDFVWQSRFYDHIIRTEKSLSNIREYIRNNPLRWKFDRNNDEEKDISKLFI